MHRHTVAVEEGLSHIRQALKEEGYKVIDLDDGLGSAEAYVITGMDEDMTGVEEMVAEGFVVDATGRQADEIIYDLEKHFRIMED